MKRSYIYAALIACVGLASCTSASAIRTSEDTAIIQVSAAPICGASGAVRSSQKSAAIETIRAGYDSYIIAAAQSQNNVSVDQLPGHYTLNVQGNQNGWNGNTTYTPGPLIIHGTHDQALGIKMFHGKPAGAIDARTMLGPKWQKIVKNGVMVCN